MADRQLTAEDLRAFHSRLADQSAGVDPAKLSWTIRDGLLLFGEIERLKAELASVRDALNAVEREAQLLREELAQRA